MIFVEIPGYATFNIENLLMDFNGTLATDGRLIEGVRERIETLSMSVNLFILTADTFGLVEETCEGLPVNIKKTKTGQEAEQKKAELDRLGQKVTAAVGNGANDVQMLKAACLGIVVIGGEGTCARAIEAADICVSDICTGLDLFLNPKRIMATLRR
ncbi:HAD family hydrolase [bacterium]|nr:HAD family hydrolase [bacterium]